MNLTLKNIAQSFSYAGETVTLFRGFELSLGQGDALTVMGPSGCGKTTLLRIVNGLQAPDEGEVLFDEFSLYGCQESERQKFRCAAMGFSDQHARMLPQLTVLENVLLPTLGLKRDFEDYGRTLLSECGLEKRIDFFPHMLSGGERQRASLARALIRSPELLLLDEPSASLDIERGDAVFSLVRALSRSKNISVLLTTHNPRALEFFPRAIHLVPEDRP